MSYCNLSKSKIGYSAMHDFERGCLRYVAGSNTMRSVWFKEFEHQARWLVKEYKQGRDSHGRRRLAWYVNPSKGHDDFMTAFFLALLGAELAQQSQIQGGFLFARTPQRGARRAPQLPSLPSGAPSPTLMAF